MNLFFVLSGLLITGILLDSRHRADYYGRFYFRRALRILPAYFATLLILVLFGLTSRGFLFMSLLYSSNLAPLFGIAMSYPVLWSLAVEEHFYFVWPAVVKRLTPAKLIWTISVIMLLSPVFRFISFHLGERYEVVKAGCSYYTWNNLDDLGLGAFIAVFVRRPGCTRAQLARLSMWLVGLGILIALIGYPFGLTTRSTAIGEALQWVPWNLCFGAILCMALVIGSGRWKEWVAPRILVFLGSISYGLYLYHLWGFQIFQWMMQHANLQIVSDLSPWGRLWTRMLGGSLLSIFLAYFSRWYFEEWFLRLKDSLLVRRAAKTSPAQTSDASPEIGPANVDKNIPETTTRI